MKYKAIVLDIDGTLIPHCREGRPSMAVIDILKKAKENLHVGIATSRSLSSAEIIFADLDFQGIAILNNGARIIDTKSNTILHEQTIEEKSLNEIIYILRKMKIEFKIQDDGIDVCQDETYIPNKPLDIATAHIIPQLATKARKKLRALSDTSTHQVKSWDEGKDMLHISHVNATKQYGIFEYAKLLNISTDEIIGIGDGYNDFPLLMACGLKIAMGNAVDEIKEIADYIAPSVTEDGVVHAVNKFIIGEA